MGEYIVISGIAIVACTSSYDEIDENLRQKAKEDRIMIGYV